MFSTLRERKRVIGQTGKLEMAGNISVIPWKFLVGKDFLDLLCKSCDMRLRFYGFQQAGLSVSLSTV